MLNSNGEIMGESRLRRPGWSHGHPVELADGLTWRLPIIDLALLITTPALCDSFAEALHLADIAVPTHFLSVESDRYRAHMAIISLRLLKLNYDLKDEDWKLLLNFRGIFGQIDVNFVVGVAIVLARPSWLPLMATSGIHALMFN